MKPSRAIQKFRSTSIKLRLASLAALACAFSGQAIADTLPAVNVGVYAVHTGGKIVYHYRVINTTQQTISAITIGRDNQNDGNPNNDVYELIELPSGWTEKFGIPVANSSSPTGWRVSLALPPEENKTHAITWEPLNDKSPQFYGGTTLGKMSISLDRPDSSYMTSHALITFGENNPIHLTVPIESLDNMPPSFTVSLNPNTILPDNKWVAVNATFTLKDDFDRNPEIKLESITANEPLEADDIRDANLGLDDRYVKFRAVSKSAAGRIYTVTYSATDASGNKTLASATVSVAATTTAPAAAPAAVITPVPVATLKVAPAPAATEATPDQTAKKRP